MKRKNKEKGENDIVWNERIRCVREERGYTQTAIADKLNMSLSTYKRLEKGENVGIYYVQQVTAFLGVKICICC
ncbi:MAG: helix-turn-helix transcriptional regulator [Lachnospiraceae bacterium]|nr:helix-turn-helix transcriptional regulator [Lachnospiraceae bacterium]